MKGGVYRMLTFGERYVIYKDEVTGYCSIAVIFLCNFCKVSQIPENSGIH